MSSRLHNKFHRHNHHTTSVNNPNYPDAAYDPIASYTSPFNGPLVVQGNYSTAPTTKSTSAVAIDVAGDIYVSGNGNITVANGGQFYGNGAGLYGVVATSIVNLSGSPYQYSSNAANPNTTVLPSLSGIGNSVLTNYSVVAGGSANKINGLFSFIACGSANTINSANSFILGSNITAGLPNYTYVNNLSSQGTIVATNFTNSGGFDVFATITTLSGTTSSQIISLTSTLNANIASINQSITNLSGSASVQLATLSNTLTSNNLTYTSILSSLTAVSTQLIAATSTLFQNYATVSQGITSLSGATSQQFATLNNTLTSNALGYQSVLSNLTATSTQLIAATSTLFQNYATVSQSITSLSGAASYQFVTLNNTLTSNNLTYTSVLNNLTATSTQLIAATSTLFQNYATVNQSITSLSGAASYQFATLNNTLTSNYASLNSSILAASGLAVSNQQLTAFNTLSLNYLSLTQQISSLSALAVSNQVLTAVNTLELNYITLSQGITSLSGAVSTQVASVYNTLTSNALGYQSVLSNLTATSTQLIAATSTLNQNYITFNQSITSLSGAASQQFASFSNTLTSNYATTTFVVQATSGAASSLTTQLQNYSDKNTATVSSTLTSLSGQVIASVVSLTATTKQINLNLNSFGDNFTIVQDATGGWMATSYAVQKSSLPVKVSGLETQSVNSGGGRNNFFILLDGTLRVVGQNASGEIGIGSKAAVALTPTMPIFKPPLVSIPITSPGADRFAGETIKMVRSLGQNTFIVTTEGRVYVSGDNSTQQLGNANSTDTNIFAEIPLSTQTYDTDTQKYKVSDPVVDIAVGTGSSGLNNTYFALTQGGRIWAWGDHTRGQSGLAGYNNAIAGATSAFANYYIPDNWQWNSTTQQQTDIQGKMTVGFSYTYTPPGTTNPITVYNVGWKYGIPMQLPKFGATLDNTSHTFSGGKTAKAISSSGNATYQTTYAIDENNSLWVWGDNGHGQYGNGEDIDTAYSYPKQIVTNLNGNARYKGDPVKKVVTGAGFFTSANRRCTSWLITTTGNVYGAGVNARYDGANWLDRYYCIGAAYNDASVNGYYSTYKDIIAWTKLNITGTVDDVVAHTDTNYTTAFALVQAGVISGGPYDGQMSYTLQGWGDTTCGQLGIGVSGTYSSTDGTVTLQAYRGITSISGPWVTGSWNNRTIPTAKVLQVAIAGNDSTKTTLVLDTLGRLWAAGYGTTGLTGNGNTTKIQNTFDRVLLNPNLGIVKRIVSTNNGYTSSTYAEITSNFLALLDTGAVVGWGANKAGQLGTGITGSIGSLPFSDVLAPTLVQIVI
jgi:alpha-tubulin suppressor-like RCC1 family protein